MESFVGTRIQALNKGTSLVVQRSRLHASTAELMSSAPGWGMKISYTPWHSRKKDLNMDFLKSVFKYCIYFLQCLVNSANKQHILTK